MLLSLGRRRQHFTCLVRQRQPPSEPHGAETSVDLLQVDAFFLVAHQDLEDVDFEADLEVEYARRGHSGREGSACGRQGVKVVWCMQSLYFADGLQCHAP